MSSVPRRMTPGACLLASVGHGAPNDKWFCPYTYHNIYYNFYIITLRKNILRW